MSAKLNKRISSVALIILATLIIGIILGWAGTRIFATPAPLQDQSYTLVSVEAGAVSEQFTAITIAEWEQHAISNVSLQGVVTHVSNSPNEQVVSGTEMYRVNLQPVIIIEGIVPAFRDMQQGDIGEDILQLQKFLIDAGHLQGEADGEWLWQTSDAVRAWQETSEMQIDEIVNLGEILFVSDLPARISVDPKLVYVGATLSGSEATLVSLDQDPQFRIPISPQQAASITADARIEITSPDDEVWDAWVIGEQTTDGQTEILLGHPNGDSVCGNSCSSISLDPGGEILRSTVITVEEVNGLVIPSAAITTSADKKTIVIDQDGTRHEVKVLAGARGLTVVEGVQQGMLVRTPAGE